MVEFVKNQILPYYIDPSIVEHGGNVTIEFASISSTWLALHQRYQPVLIYFAFYFMVSFLYMALGAVFIIIEQFGFLQKYKINKETKKSEDYIKCLLNLMLNNCVVIPLMLVSGWPFLPLFFTIQSPVEEFPSLPVVIIHLIVCLYVEDIGHYIAHRILHIPFMYKNIHKKHHEFQVTFAMAGNYADPLETLFLSVATFLPIVIIPKLHLFTFYLWILVRWLDAAIEHSGYDIVPHWLPYQGGTPFHDYHHTQFTYNFGSRFTYLDKFFGTYSDKTSPKSFNTKNRKDR